jgi:signal transduction histidine kinase
VTDITSIQRKILVADADEAGRYVKCRALRGAGFDVSEARTGAEALTQVRGGRFCLLILDVKLPDVSGLELCRQVKAELPAIAVLLTSAAFRGTADRGPDVWGCADAYLMEPINPDELIATARALIRLHHVEQELRTVNRTLDQRIAERTSELETANRKLADQVRQHAEADEALRHALKLDALGQITGGIAHDFNNLLTVVLGSFSLMERELRERLPDETLLRHIESGRKAAEDCEYLTQQLLSFARRDPLRAELIDANDRLRALANLLERALGERITLTLNFAPRLWPCRVDPGQFEAAMLNLAVNARDAMGGVGTFFVETENVSLWPDMSTYRDIEIPRGLPRGEYVCVMVTDTGAGMSDSVLQHAFEPFFTTKDVGKGSGLGLSQVYGFVAQAGGQLGVASRAGQGTRIAMFLPRSREGSIRPAQEAARADMPGGTETVLVVEDNFLVLAFTVQTLSALGYRVLEAPDGAHALEVIRDERNIDVLFTDMVMPNDMSGLALAKEALRARPDLKILLTSGYSPDVLREDAVDIDFAYLAKPYSPEGLAQRLREVLEA